MNISKDVLSESNHEPTIASGKVGMLHSDCVTHSKTQIQESSRQHTGRFTSSFFSRLLVMKQ
ncbi:MAG: hypothetical protein QG577_370 [Thermodesulfobacteriota bacterium]|nr:hypothetical protein [Thermodesulfobacteriota bacterium]